jgi:hypothetical protein
LSDHGVEVFRSLQARARAGHGGNTQPLLVIYAVESFLRRLAASDYAERMVLKGGMLMAASGVRRMTQDADLSTHGVANDAELVREVVAGICSLVPDPDDGIVIDPTSIGTEVMREGDEYQGVRCKLVAGLGRARIPFALDISFGDPGRSMTIELASVIDQPDVSLRAYPLALNLAEKTHRDAASRDEHPRSGLRRSVGVQPTLRLRGRRAARPHPRRGGASGAGGHAAGRGAGEHAGPPAALRGDGAADVLSRVAAGALERAARRRDRVRGSALGRRGRGAVAVERDSASWR